jgi:hypothetical protein
LLSLIGRWTFFDPHTYDKARYLVKPRGASKSSQRIVAVHSPGMSRTSRMEPGGSGLPG